MQTKLNGVGTTAAILGPIALLFQLIKIIQKENADEISWLWVGIELIVSILWLIYSMKNKLLPIFISCIFFILINLIIISVKIIYDKKNKKEIKNITDLF